MRKKINKPKQAQKCLENHEPNETTLQTLADIRTRKGIEKAKSVEELFEKLTESDN